MAATSEDAKTERLTLRLSSVELEHLRARARQRGTDVATIAREAIREYLGARGGGDELELLSQGLQRSIEAQADRIIERNEQITRALISAINENFIGK